MINNLGAGGCGEIGQQVRAHGAEPGNQSVVLRSHVVEGN